MLQLKNIVKDYITGDTTVHALKGVSINFRPNEFVSILGQSGCGKTTLLNIVGGLDQYTSGDLIIKGKSTKQYKDREWDAYRNHSIGFVFQSYNLIMHQTVLQNVELALTLSGVSKSERRRRAKEVLEKVGLGNQLNKKPNQMSGGQMQRVAIARALINDPEILLADEPTGALDTETSVQIMDLLKEIADDRLVIMVTHNPELAEQYSTRIIKLLDGEVKDDSNPYTDEDIEEENKAFAKAAEGVNAKEQKKAEKLNRMSYSTALGLSFKNLLTKKGRTILTAFAGSIGIIGIALILSLSDGFRNYIKSVEEDTLSTYPLEITDESVDMTSMMTSMLGKTPDSGEEHDLDKIYSNNFIGDYMNTVLGEVKVNDMISFRDYIEEGDGNVMYDYASDIKYTYGITINAYKSDYNDSDLYRVNPSTVFDSIGFGTMTEMSNLGMTTVDTTSVWSEMLSNEELLHSQYDVVAGDWPSSYDEVVLVVTGRNEITDYELYALGIRDVSELQEMMAAALKGETKTFPNTSYTYDEILGTTFKVLPSSSYYQYDESAGCYVDMSDEEDFVKEQLDKDGITIKISGIVRANEDATVQSITTPIGYTHELVERLIDMAKNSEAGKAQLEDENLNIFTGYEFGADIDEEAKKQMEESSQEMMEQMGIADLSDEELAQYMTTLPADQLQVMIEALSAQSESSGMLSISDLKTAEDATFDENLVSLGIAYENDPKNISIYPIDFESKEKIIEIIDEYNAMVKADGQDEKEISYTDMVGTMMSSISTIINSISYVLMAFVAISLVVSSIMIGIITYISVLERTKEIGVLRSIGASKKDISRVFNAETIIIGFVAGLMGILIAILLNIPINMVINHVAGLKNVAKLPLLGGIALVLISVLLTMIGGLIPSKLAAKKDPVEALRME
jgi:putative ABC transport system permease protein